MFVIFYMSNVKKFNNTIFERFTKSDNKNFVSDPD